MKVINWIWSLLCAGLFISLMKFSGKSVVILFAAFSLMNMVFPLSMLGALYNPKSKLSHAVARGLNMLGCCAYILFLAAFVVSISKLLSSDLCADLVPKDNDTVAILVSFVWCALPAVLSFINLDYLMKNSPSPN